MWDVYKNQWWNAPDDRRKEAYYMTLRVHYGMPALEAWNYLKKAYADYPEFMGNPIETLRTAIKH